VDPPDGLCAEGLANRAQSVESGLPMFKLCGSAQCVAVCDNWYSEGVRANSGLRPWRQPWALYSPLRDTEA
jgi:hypothetical protein